MLDDKNNFARAFIEHNDLMDAQRRRAALKHAALVLLRDTVVVSVVIALTIGAVLFFTAH